MKKNAILLKGMAALALSAAAASCSHDIDTFASAQEDQYAKQFDNIVMGDLKIDAHQTWNASVATTLTVSSEAAGTIKVYTANPFGNTTAPLTTKRIAAGETLRLDVARPQDVTRLYVTYLDADGFVLEQNIDATQETKVAFSNGGTTATARTRSIGKIPSAVDFPDAPDAADYATEVPSEGVTLWSVATKGFGGWTGTTGAYLLDEDYINLTGVNSTLYIQGDFRPNYFAIPTGTTIYLLPDATLTLPESSDGCYSFGQTGVTVYVAPNAKMVSGQKLQFSNTTLYNAGRVEAPELDVCGTGLVYNQGTLDIDGDAYVSNGASTIVNAGIFTADNFETKGSGKFLNTEDGNATIKGETFTSSNKNYWVNDGVYTTATFPYTAGSDNIVNNCMLNVTDVWDIKTGSGTFYNSGSVVAKNLLMDGPSHISMAANSMIKVLDTATFDCSNDGYGIYSIATGTDYAVFQAKHVVKGRENQRREVTYSGNLIVDAEEHFAQGHDGSGHPSGSYYLVEKGAKMANEDTNVSYTIKASKCSPGYSHTGNGGGKGEPTMYYFYAFEDLGATGDFDFNDVVLGVTAPVDGTSEIYLMAAGGTLNTIVRLDGTQIGEEVHEAFGVTTRTMVNTTTVNKSFVKLGEATGVEDPSALPLSIFVSGAQGSMEVAAPAEGGTPLMIRVPGNDQGKWFWPKERTNIVKPYSGFGKWGANYTTNTNWYKNPSGDVVNY